ADADAAALAVHLRGIPPQNGLVPVVVARTGEDGSATVVLPDAREVVLPAAASKWTGRTPAKLFKRGDLARIKAGAEPGAYVVDQIPRAQAALVSLDASNGALRALVGGYSFAGNKFNRATQARRQPGSSFKPFLYAASFEKG